MGRLQSNRSFLKLKCNVSAFFRKHLFRSQRYYITSVMNAKYAVMTIITSLLIAALLLTYDLVKTDPAKGEYVDVYIVLIRIFS